MTKKLLTILSGILFVLTACSEGNTSPSGMITDSPTLEIQPSPTNLQFLSATATVVQSPTSLPVSDAPGSPISENQINGTQEVTGDINSMIPSDIWTRRDVPPEGVIEQISFVRSGGAGGAFACSPSTSEPITRPIIWFGHTDKTAIAEINSLINICIEGLGDIESAVVEIKGPSDFTVDYQKTIEDWYENSSPVLRISTTPKSGDPLGIYTLYVSSENGEATAKYEVISAKTPALWFDGYHHVYNEIGLDTRAKTKLYLAGLYPNSDIDFQLFKGFEIEIISDPDLCGVECEKTNLEYLTSWQIPSDERGEIIFDLNSGEETSKGEYLLTISGPDASLCDIKNLPLEEYGDWGSITCDLVLQIQIGDEPLPTIENTDGNIAAFTCPDAPPTRLVIGMLAFVSLDPPMANKLRKNPGTSSDEIGKIPPGQEVVISAGPECKNKYVWWKVIVKGTNQSGWTVEGDTDNYWLIPSEGEP